MFGRDMRSDMGADFIACARCIELCQVSGNDAAQVVGFGQADDAAGIGVMFAEVRRGQAVRIEGEDQQFIGCIALREGVEGKQGGADEGALRALCEVALPVGQEAARGGDHLALRLFQSRFKGGHVDLFGPVGDDLCHGCGLDADDLDLAQIALGAANIPRDAGEVGVELQDRERGRHCYCWMLFGSHVASCGKATKITTMSSIKPTIGIAVLEI